METNELLKLFQCLCDTGTEVVCICAKIKLLTSYGGCFTTFLDDKKHHLFHQLDGVAHTCCLCPSTGRSNTKVCKMEKWKFEQIYDDSGNIVPGDVIKHKTHILQECVHRYVSKPVTIKNLDICLLVFLLKNCTMLSNKEDTALANLISLRNEICHLNKTNCISLPRITSMWSELEKAVLDLVDPIYHTIFRTAIQSSKKGDLERSEIDELRCKIAEVSKKTEEDTQCIATKANDLENVVAKQFRHLDGALQNNRLQVASVESKLSNQLIGVIKNQRVMMELMKLMKRELSERDTGDQQTMKMRSKLTSSSLDEQAETAVIENRPTKEDKAEDTRPGGMTGNLPFCITDNVDEIEILKKKKNCIILELAASPLIFTSPDTLRSAILKLVRKVLDAGKVNTSIEDTIHVQMSFDSPLTLHFMSHPYTETVEPETEKLIQIQTDDEIVLLPHTESELKATETYDLKEPTKEYSDIGTCHLCIVRSKIIKRLGRLITHQEQQIEQQKDNIEQQGQRMEDQKEYIEYQKQQLKHERHYTNKLKQRLQSKNIVGQRLYRKKNIHEENPSTGKMSDELEELIGYSFMQRPIHTDHGKRHKMRALDQRKDLSTELHHVPETKRQQYNIKSGKVMMFCENILTHRSEDDLKRIQERFVKFPNFTVVQCTSFQSSIIDQTILIETSKSRVDCLILILVDVDPEYMWTASTLLLFETSLHGIPIVTIAEHSCQRVQSVLPPRLGEHLVVTSYTGPSPYDSTTATNEIGTSHSILHYLPTAMENMKDGDDFAAILRDISEKINGQSPSYRSTFLSPLKKKLVLK